MNKLYIGIDPSISSTAVCISTPDQHETVNLNFTSNKTSGKWFKALSPKVEYAELTYKDDKDYSESELLKLSQYNLVTNIIADVIKGKTGDSEIVFAIESYSQSSNAGPLIDLVTFGTLLRYHLTRTFPGAKFMFVPPMTLKKFACFLTYGDRHIDPKTKNIRRNDEGVAGGSFKKREMLKAVLDSGKHCSFIHQLPEYMVKEAMTNSSVPKPIDDLIDAYWLSQYAENQDV